MTRLDPDDLAAIRAIVREEIAAIVPSTTTRAGRSRRLRSSSSAHSVGEVLREELDPTPMAITQRNCQAVLGLSPRRFLELLRRDDAPTPARLGKLRAVRADVMIAYLDRLGAKVRTEPESDGAEALLRQYGCAPLKRRG